MTSSILRICSKLFKYLVNTMDYISSIPSFLMGFVSVSLEKNQCSCAPCILLACVLSVAILYSRSGNFFLICVQYYVQSYSPILLPPICILNEALASPEDRSVQFEQITKWTVTLDKYYENQQQELKLLNQQDTLDERKNPEGLLVLLKKQNIGVLRYNSVAYILSFGKMPKRFHASRRNG